MARDEAAREMPRETGGQRIAWAKVPVEVRASIEDLLGSKVISAISQPGGFSEGVAARLRLADEGRVFVKAASSLVAPGVARFHRREIEVSRRLPGGLPVPRLLNAYDDDTWVALVFEEIDGRLPAQPWRRDELDRVLAATSDMARVLTRSTRRRWAGHGSVAGVRWLMRAVPEGSHRCRRGPPATSAS